MLIKPADVGHTDGITIVTTTMVCNEGHVVGFEDGTIFEDDEVVAESRGCLVAHKVGGFHFAVWAIGGAVYDYLSNLAHGERLGCWVLVRLSRGSLTYSRCRRLML